MDLFSSPTPTRKPVGGHQSARSATCIWLTPPEIIAALGPFDLDPCACSEPRPWPTAAHHYTSEDNGLAQPWNGRVWLNPPYGPPPIIGPWMRRMAAHGHGTALIFARTETATFFETVWRGATAVLFLEGRLHLLALGVLCLWPDAHCQSREEYEGDRLELIEIAKRVIDAD